MHSPPGIKSLTRNPPIYGQGSESWGPGKNLCAEIETSALGNENSGPRNESLPWKLKLLPK
jgi:hypothetical protein